MSKNLNIGYIVCCVPVGKEASACCVNKLSKQQHFEGLTTGMQRAGWIHCAVLNGKMK